MKQLTLKEVNAVNGGRLGPLAEAFPNPRNNTTVDSKCYGFNADGVNKVSKEGLDGVDCRVLCCQKSGMYDWFQIINGFVVLYSKC